MISRTSKGPKNAAHARARHYHLQASQAKAPAAPALGLLVEWDRPARWSGLLAGSVETGQARGLHGPAEQPERRRLRRRQSRWLWQPGA
jgi:hypothetical protein